MNSDVIKTIFFYDENHNDKAIENRAGDIQERSKEEVLNEIQNKIREQVILSYIVVRDGNLVTYQLKQEGGTVNLRMSLFDSVLPELKNILNPIPRKVADAKKRDSIRITIGEETCRVSHFTDQCVTSKEISKNGSEVLDYIRCLKKNNEIISSIRSGENTFCYIFETKEYDKFYIYVSANNEEVVEKLNKLATVKVKNKKKLAKVAGMVLCGFGLTFALLKNPSFHEKAQKIHDKIVEKREANELLENNFYRIKSLYMQFKTSELSEEEMLELNSKLSEVLTLLHAVESKDECVGILERYEEEIRKSYQSNRRR